MTSRLCMPRVLPLQLSFRWASGQPTTWLWHSARRGNDPISHRHCCLPLLQGGGAIYMGVEAFDASAAGAGGSGTCKATPTDIRYATVT